MIWCGRQDHDTHMSYSSSLKNGITPRVVMLEVLVVWGGVQVEKVS